MTIKIEDTLNEVQVAGGIYSAKPISTTATATFAKQSVTGALTIGGTLAVTGAATLQSTLSVLGGAVTVTGTAGLVLGTGGPSLYVGAAGPTTGPSQASVLGSLFINTGGTGPGSRLYVSIGTGATAWTPITTAA